MENFILTTIPTAENLADVQQLPNGKYLIRLELEEQEDGQTQCYECMSDTNDVELVAQHLQEWKAQMEARRISRERKFRMKEILAELEATDYLSLKAFEGEDMSEHPNWKETRAALRAEYRQLEAQVNGSNE